jgi:hypothetical protein
MDPHKLKPHYPPKKKPVLINELQESREIDRGGSLSTGGTYVKRFVMGSKYSNTRPLTTVLT